MTVSVISAAILSLMCFIIPTASGESVLQADEWLAPSSGESSDNVAGSDPETSSDHRSDTTLVMGQVE